ncbi:MAG TPA: hypothetical protein VGV61_14705 [Thermoanaerobaculia bacterium]|jgi:hypothetical protein|nr:hypothetical protein [Thermoanaerobaculia bacterium]
MRKREWTVLTSAVVALLCVASAARADLRTKGIRLVPEKAWTATKGPVRVTHATELADPQAVEFGNLMDGWVRKACDRLHYPVADDAPVELHFTIDRFDAGSQAKRLITGFGGQGLVVGTLVVRRGGEEVGRYRFSSKLSGGFTGGSVDAMAKEVGPPLVLKLTKGESDESLHEGADQPAN